MPQKIRDIMTKNPITLSGDSTVQEAARAMRERDIGTVLVTDAKQCLQGIVTDRDIVVRSVAKGENPEDASVREVATTDVQTLSPDDSIDDAIKKMEEGDVRRLPVVEDGKPVGIVSLGDLAKAKDQDSALANISSASPNN